MNRSAYSVAAAALAIGLIASACGSSPSSGSTTSAGNKRRLEHHRSSDHDRAGNGGDHSQRQCSTAIADTDTCEQSDNQGA